MKLITAALAAALTLAGIAPVFAAPPAVMSYAVINSGHAQIMLSTSGHCGVYQRPMKPAAKLYATCSANDGKATIAATSYPGKQMLCSAHITRQGGIDYTTFVGSPNCHENRSLNHIDLVVTLPAARR